MASIYNFRGISYEGFCRDGFWVRYKIPESEGIIFPPDGRPRVFPVKYIEIYNGDVEDALVLNELSDQGNEGINDLDDENAMKLFKYLIDNREHLIVDSGGKLPD